MNRIVHLSDLHFGRTRADLLQPLTDAVTSADPDLVVVSGDLTQRARSHEFRAARDFLDALPAPWIAVPGNHDVPLYNLWERMLRPYRRYRTAISRDLAPSVVTDQVAVVGCNTVDPHRHQRGKIRKRDVRRICRVFAEGPTERLNILFVHHPLEQDADADKALMKRAGMALGHLTGCGAHVVLSGHLHRWRAGPFLEGARGEGPVQIHSGTSLSNRLREEVNDFAILDVRRDHLRVTRMVADGEALHFRPEARVAFRRGATGLSLAAEP